MKIPANLPAPPAPPEGMTWEYRGMGWSSNEYKIYAIFGRTGRWHTSPDKHRPTGDGGLHYVEAVPATETLNSIKERVDRLNDVEKENKILTARVLELEKVLTEYHKLLPSAESRAALRL